MEEKADDPSKQPAYNLDQHRERESNLKQPHEGWEDQFRQMHENGDDKLLIPDVFSDEV